MTRLKSVPKTPDWRDDFLRSDRGIRGCAANVALILEHDERWQGVVAWDEFGGRLVLRKPAPWEGLLDGAEAGPWQDGDDARLGIWLERHYRLVASKAVRREALRQAAERRQFHPVREHLSGTTWDGVERLSSLFPYYFGGGESPYLRKVSCWWLMSAAARVDRPGAKVDTMVVLEGTQGIKKSSALRALALRPEWFLESKVEIGERNGYQILRGKLIVEFAELSSWTKASRNELKSFLTAQQDTYFPRYGEHQAEWPRQCVFAGTTNDPQYLDDPSGARRIWPVACGEIRLEELQEDLLQLWAEALHYVRQGLRWWPEGEEIAEFHEVQEERQHEDAWQDAIVEWLRTASPTQLDNLTVRLIAEKAIKIDTGKIDRSVEMRIAAALRRLSYIRHRKRVDGERQYVFSKQ